MNNGFDLFMKEAARPDSSIIPWLTFEQFKHTLVEYQLTLNWWGTYEFLTIGQSISFPGVVLSASNLSLRTDWFRVEKKATNDGRQSSSHHLILLVETPVKKNPVMITQFLEKVVPHVPKNLRTRQRDTLDPAVQQHSEWLSSNCWTYFSSSSSSTWTEIPTWWSSSSWDHQWQECKTKNGGISDNPDNAGVTHRQVQGDLYAIEIGKGSQLLSSSPEIRFHS